MDNKAIRRQNLLALLAGFDSDKAFAEFVEMDPAHVSQIKSGKNMGDNIARKIEQKTGKPFGWMDYAHTLDKNGELTAHYNDTPAPPGWYDQDLIREATEYLFVEIGIEVAEQRGAKWTAAAILKLHDLLKDPAAKNLSKSTILRLLD